MITIQGKGVFDAIAIGQISVFRCDEIGIKRESIKDTDKEYERFEKAKEKALWELSILYDQSLSEIGEENARIFEIHRMMLVDLDYNDAVCNIIKEQHNNAEYAVATVSDSFAEKFLSMDSEYMKERASDVRDISNRVLRCLRPLDKEDKVSGNNMIICADDLVPSETVQFDKNKVLAFVTQKGSLNSHTAILARTMNIPAVIGATKLFDCGNIDGRTAIVNGYTGEVFIDPDNKTLEKFKKKQREDFEKRERLKSLKGKKNITLDGQTIEIYANIGGMADLDEVISNDAGGIGLFRSEFLYLENDDYPTEEFQFNVYKNVLKRMDGKKVIIRTLDIGADKKIKYFNLDAEENPALGYRAIRICLTRQDIFKTQLRALYRASVFGNLSIMFPMIISKKEILLVKEIVEQVKGELKKEGIPFSENIEIGIMIETPAAALISDELAMEVDFFSVGTNDLIQYTLALDRQNPKLDSFYDSHHDAVLKLIRFTADNAHKHNKWIGICGELGADLSLTEQFLKMGIDELSVSPSLVLSVREKVRNSIIK